jgi:hypothetical protein
MNEWMNGWIWLSPLQKMSPAGSALMPNHEAFLPFILNQVYLSRGFRVTRVPSFDGICRHFQGVGYAKGQPGSKGQTGSPGAVRDEGPQGERE